MAESLSTLLERQVARWTDRKGDWDAFADARVDGYRRAQHRFIGYGASGKADGTYIPAEHFTLSIMFVPPGQGNAAHTHEVEEVFFILEGKVKVFFEDGAGGRVETRFAHLFLKLADKAGRAGPEGIAIQMALSRQDLADLTGTTIETCIRIMSRWSKEGLVRTERNGFVVLDRAALERRALAESRGP